MNSKCTRQLVYMHGSRDGDRGPDLALKNHKKNIKFLTNTSPDSLKNNASHHRHASKTPFKWRFADRPMMAHLKTYAAISNAHLFRVCKRGKLSGSCLSTLNGFGSIQLPIFLCHIGVPTFSSQNN